MAASRSAQSTCNCFKRLRISHLPTSTNPQSRTLHTTSRVSHPSDSDGPPTPPRKPTSPLLALRNSVDAPPDRANPPQAQIERALLALAHDRDIPLPAPLTPPASPSSDGPVRLPRAVQALYLTPLRRAPTHAIPVANLQLRSYSVRNLEFMADFALRAAYYLDLPAKGPVPLPRITERWTVPRDVFIFKKSQENWERITVRWLIQIQDGHPEVVQRWLAFVRKWCWYGVGMKANVWEHEGMDVVANMDRGSDGAFQAGLQGTEWDLIGRRKGMESAQEVSKFLRGKGFGPVPVADAERAPAAKKAAKAAA